MKKRNKVLILITMCLLLIFTAGVVFFVLNNKKSDSTNIALNSEENKKTEFQNALDEIDGYQAKYFEIIKRHDALLDMTNSTESKKDIKELSLLFQEVKNKINKDNSYLAEYEKIKEKRIKNLGNTEFEINTIASENHKAVDKLMNDIYSNIKSQLNKEDFEKLNISQKNWLSEVENYNNIFNSKDFGTIKTIIKLDYEINMKSYRTLLLMLYLNNIEHSS